MSKRITAAVVNASIAKVVADLRGDTDDTKQLRQILGQQFGRQLAQTYRRVSEVKNLINRHKPAKLMDIFVSPRLTSGTDEVDEIGLYGRLQAEGRLVVQGKAGLGKSMLLKFMALKHLLSPTSRIPLFLELRKVDFDRKETVVEAVFRMYWPGSGQREHNILQGGLRAGYFNLILDGFDEVPDSFVEMVEKEVLELAFQYPETGLLISGRRNRRFSAWEQFHVYDLQPLDKEKTIELINRLDFDVEVKAKFIVKLEETSRSSNDLSFIGTPLMAVLILLNFETYAEIPSKLYQFYEQAFSILMREHDATKSQFRRTLVCGLDDDTIKRAFSRFCAVTYAKRKFEYRRDEAISFIKDVFKGMAIEADPLKYLKDLTDNVGVLQYEGLEYSYIHRTFQEYFVAVFLSSAPLETIERFLALKIHTRAENVLSMLIEMDRDRLEKEWVLPQLIDLEEEIGGFEKGDDELIDFAIKFWRVISFDLSADDLYGLSGPTGVGVDLLHILSLMYSSEPYQMWFTEDWSKFHERASALARDADSNKLKGVVSKPSNAGPSGDGTVYELALEQRHSAWLAKHDYADNVRPVIRRFREIKNEVEKRVTAQQVMLDDFL